MPFELDHLFICTAENAPEADALAAIGLVEGSSNVHPGQGTANRRFFFHNLMLELLWVTNPDEANSEMTRPLYLWERWRDRQHGACPFGICLRSTGQANATLPFPSWDYRPSYLPPTLSISVGTSADVATEPLVFSIPFGKRPDAYEGEKAQPLNDAADLKEVTRVTLTMPQSKGRSPVLDSLAQHQFMTLNAGDAYAMELGFDGETQGIQKDLHPTLPLTLCW